MRKRTQLSFVGVLVLFAAVAGISWAVAETGQGTAAGTAVAQQQTPSKGLLTEGADASGNLDWSKIPDFVGVSDRQGSLAGYARKADVLPQPGPANQAPTLPDPATVFSASDLTTVVGHLYSTRGYVPLGADPTSYPEIPIHTWGGLGPMPTSAPPNPGDQSGVVKIPRDPSGS